ncbi:hypothetical protein BJ742DRAFT_678272 [Cladochytrium replicatum]|nr:hypothetical protein BJ742DRAFT_678272 [Cladochytrium replicatum]
MELERTKALASCTGATIESRRRRYKLSGHPLPPTVLPQIFTRTECDKILGAVEKAASERGWDTDRHVAHPTVDIPNSALDPETSSFVERALYTRVVDRVAEMIGFHCGDLEFVDLFYVQYEATGQRSLGLHTDGCLISMNALINEGGEFEGGGTYFQREDRTYSMARGDVVVHDSALMHSGREILRGRRMVMVGFVESRRAERQKVVGSRGPRASEPAARKGN